MARQERAEQTRQRIVRAASAEFAEHGYDGTSLHRIVRSAGVTMGALTFHFPSKSALADAVQEAGTTATREVMLGTAAAPGLRGVLDEVLTLADALRGTPSIRAAARLTREGHAGGQGWYASWVPGLREALERAWHEERLEGGLTPAATASLLSHILLGVEAAATTPDALRAVAGDDPGEGLAQALTALGALLAPSAAAGPVKD
ncbi:TetR family transcriptional regulator [Streptomyces sp. AK04-3B]|uniref:TetR family transcriptional regulator n=1 Tax=Streptomyces sp. AK04-3B TaxID=3028650 RepID=UPI0029B49FBA|nr:TetR family transcriptional regulator [Streptomyces sp. AK04-3B]MDX3804042.1 TetR family transcriptional regulator [Streptomyces sp. AK04-3B]